MSGVSDPEGSNEGPEEASAGVTRPSVRLEVESDDVGPAALA